MTNHSRDCFHGRCPVSNLLRIQRAGDDDDNNDTGNCGDPAPASGANDYDAPDDQGLLVPSSDQALSIPKILDADSAGALQNANASGFLFGRFGALRFFFGLANDRSNSLKLFAFAQVH